MSEFAVIDVETSRLKHGEIPKTKFWGYADESGYKRFEKTSQLEKFLRRQSPKVLLHHTNFDVIQLLVDGARDFRIIKSHNTRLIKCAWHHHTLLNSFSVFPVALGKIFQAFGFEKTDLGNLDKRNYDDCVIGLKCILELDSVFQGLVNVSPLHKGTIAATGFAAAELIAGRMPKDLRFLEAYRGGRVEVFDTRRINNVSKLDIASSYPTSFCDAPRKSFLLKVKVTTSDWFAPLFDAGRNDLLCFPNGTFRSYVYDDVWQRYIEPHTTNTKLKIVSRHKIDLNWICELNDFIKDVYAKKQANPGNAIGLCCKLLVNSCYGRIGLKGESERARILPYIPDGDDITIYRLPRRKFLVFDTVLREPRSNFPFAAYITDNARARLYQAFVRNSALYGDTDSIFTSVPKRRFEGELGKELGQWNFEGKGWFKANNVKDYFHECYSCKKSRSRKCNDCGGKRFVEVRKGGENFHVWTLKRFAAGKKVESVHRTRQSELRKRLVLPDGRTQPLIVKP